MFAAVERPAAHAWLEMIATDKAFATVGLSQLTTSRRLGTRPLTATRLDDGYRLDGAMPWVTGAEMADVIVTGAAGEEGAQLLVALPTDRPGLDVRPPFPLAALPVGPRPTRAPLIRLDEVAAHAGHVKVMGDSAIWLRFGLTSF